MGLSVGAMMKFERLLSNGKKVITQTINGKTVTNVLDKEGNVILARAKKIDWQWVGNKKVSTRTDLYRYEDCAKKRILDRVYDQSGTLLGRRKLYYYSSRNDCEALNNAMKNENFGKSFYVGNLHKHVEFVNGVRRHAYISNWTPENQFFNEKGLPKFNVETFGMDKLI